MSIIYCEDEQAFLFHFVVGGTIAEVSCCCCCRGLYDNAARMDTSALQYELGPPRSRSPVVCVCVVHLLGPHPFFSLSSLPFPPPSPSSSTLFPLLITAPQKRTETHYPRTRFYECSDSSWACFNFPGIICYSIRSWKLEFGESGAAREDSWNPRGNEKRRTFVVEEGRKLWTKLLVYY